MSKYINFSFLFIVLITLVLTCTVNCELHRAKAKSPVKPKSRFTNEDNHELTDAVFTEDVGQQSTLFASGMSHGIDVWTYSLLSVLMVALTGVLPLFIIPAELWKSTHSDASNRRLRLFLSYAVGGLLGDVFLHLLPEVWMHVDSGTDSAHIEVSWSGYWLIGGLIIFLMLEKLFADNDDEPGEGCASEVTSITRNLGDDTVAQRTRSHKTNGKLTNGTSNGHMTNGHSDHDLHQQNDKRLVEQPSPVTRIKTVGWLNLFANFMDNFTHGLAIGASYCIGPKTGLLTTAAILLHEIPHEIGDFAILLKSGFKLQAAAKAQLLTACGGLLGAVFALAASSTQAAGDSTSCLLSFTSGGFLYIALVTILPELQRETDAKESVKQVLLLVAGVLTMASIGLFCD